MRQHGVIWSFLLGSAVFTGLVALDEVLQIKSIFSSKILLKIGKAKWNLTIGVIISLFSLLFTLGIAGILLMLYRIYTLFGVFLFIFLLTISIAIIFIVSKGIDFSLIYPTSSVNSDISIEEDTQKREKHYAA